jgi:hypothetical protein
MVVSPSAFETAHSERNASRQKHEAFTCEFCASCSYVCSSAQVFPHNARPVVHPRPRRREERGGSFFNPCVQLRFIHGILLIGAPPALFAMTHGPQTAAKN